MVWVFYWGGGASAIHDCVKGEVISSIWLAAEGEIVENIREGLRILDFIPERPISLEFIQNNEGKTLLPPFTFYEQNNSFLGLSHKGLTREIISSIYEGEIANGAGGFATVHRHMPRVFPCYSCKNYSSILHSACRRLPLISAELSDPHVPYEELHKDYRGPREDFYDEIDWGKIQQEAISLFSELFGVAVTENTRLEVRQRAGLEKRLALLQNL